MRPQCGLSEHAVSAAQPYPVEGVEEQELVCLSIATGALQLVGYGQCNKRRTTPNGASRRAGAGPLPPAQRRRSAATGQLLQGGSFSAHFAVISPGLRFGCGNIVGEV